MRLTYKFDNDETKLDVERKDYLKPTNVKVFFREGDFIYVEDGDHVNVNELLIESPTGIKTYSSIAGMVEKKNDFLLIQADTVEAGDIEVDTYKISDLKKDEIIDICSNIGISYDNKLIVNKLKSNNKLLIINGMDVEPYQFNSNYLFQDNVKNLLDTINLLSSKFNLDAHLMLSKYDENNVTAVKTIIGGYPNIEFHVVGEVFPYNTDKMLAKKYFYDYKFEDILFLDTSSLFRIFIALRENRSVTEKFFTVLINEPDKVWVVNSKYGANLEEIIKNTITTELEGKTIYLNNYLRKVECTNLSDLTLTDNIKSIFIFDKDDRVNSKCIKCGKCVDICPMGLNPMNRRLDAACIRCGLCNYVCPANINLLGRDK